MSELYNSVLTEMLIEKKEKKKKKKKETEIFESKKIDLTKKKHKKNIKK
tara:strand:+ start:704 stop:850 length:147 start_codon:yes stop_codon:yes gene_type:complete